MHRIFKILNILILIVNKIFESNKLFLALY